MVEEQNTQSSRFINIVDQELRENIMRLDQKLKGLNAEIAAKIESIKSTGGTQEQIEAMTTASADIIKAINSIEELVNAVVSDDLTDKQFLKLNQENIEGLREVFASQLASVNRLKDEL